MPFYVVELIHAFWLLVYLIEHSVLFHCVQNFISLDYDKINVLVVVSLGPKPSFKYLGSDGGLSQVESLYPALLVKQQSTACVEKNCVEERKKQQSTTCEEKKLC